MLDLKGLDKQEKITAITEHLEQGVKELFQDENYRAYLTKMSQVYSYSVNNIMLILSQKPDATIVGGMKMWNETFHRYVKKGEQGIAILAPVKKSRWVSEIQRNEDGTVIYDENGEPVKESKLVAYYTYRIVYVFDVSQTDGEPMPSLNVQELGGCVENYDKIFNALVDMAGIPVRFEDIRDGAKGYYSHSGYIALKEGMSELQTLKTLVHELAHSILHGGNALDAISKSRRTKEVEAESVAFTVCSYLGLDTSDYSFTYVGDWAGGQDTKVLMASMETIRKCAANIIETVTKAVGIETAEESEVA